MCITINTDVSWCIRQYLARMTTQMATTLKLDFIEYLKAQFMEYSGTRVDRNECDLNEQSYMSATMEKYVEYPLFSHIVATKFSGVENTLDDLETIETTVEEVVESEVQEEADLDDYEDGYDVPDEYLSDYNIFEKIANNDKVRKVVDTCIAKPLEWIGEAIV